MENRIVNLRDILDDENKPIEEIYQLFNAISDKTIIWINLLGETSIKNGIVQDIFQNQILFKNREEYFIEKYLNNNEYSIYNDDSKNHPIKYNLKDSKVLGFTMIGNKKNITVRDILKIKFNILKKFMVKGHLINQNKIMQSFESIDEIRNFDKDDLIYIESITIQKIHKCAFCLEDAKIYNIFSNVYTKQFSEVREINSYEIKCKNCGGYIIDINLYNKMIKARKYNKESEIYWADKDLIKLFKNRDKLKNLIVRIDDDDSRYFIEKEDILKLLDNK
ncbi:hypothetical protein OSC52_00315 [Clostridium pasteurianum]|uniref:hypothetical protein n=1 Tax=Clostridium pasteurianum TaxID=1501 RepID=UPI002260EB75|nr:hypothetical protein [Clostridium pasteurianum]UZW14350.1 hypothetical protein OSC52_00315 [Clostridium pasteurianum]